MATRTALSTLVTMLKGEIGASTSVGSGTDAELKVQLSNKQKFLAALRDWSELTYTASVDVSGGVRTAAKPAINYNRPLKVEAQYNGTWREVDYGIGVDELNTFNSELLEASDPIQRWAHYTLTTFEVWPVPLTAQVVRFVGQKVLDTLASDTDLCNLDDMLLVLSVAADIKAAGNRPDAQRAAALAASLYASLSASSQQRYRTFSLVPREVRERETILIGSSAAQSTYMSHSGSVALTVGEATGSVAYNIGFTPTSVRATVSQPSAGLVIVPSPVKTSLTLSGFNYSLSAAPDAAGYYLEYEVSN